MHKEEKLFDLLSAIELTASAAVVVATLAWLFGATPRERILIGAGLTAWFAGVLWLGATGALQDGEGAGVLGLGAAVVLPVLVLTILSLGTEFGRARIAAAPLSTLVAVQAVRVLGVSFVLLHAAGRLPAPFAPIAGWGDILVGMLAIPVAWVAARFGSRADGTVLLWNILGIADLVAAVGLGAMSSPGPLRIFMQELGGAIMTSVPWIIIPCFLVPALIALHLVTFYKLPTQLAAATASPVHA